MGLLLLCYILCIIIERIHFHLAGRMRSKLNAKRRWHDENIFLLIDCYYSTFIYSSLHHIVDRNKRFHFVLFRSENTFDDYHYTMYNNIIWIPEIEGEKNSSFVFIVNECTFRNDWSCSAQLRSKNKKFSPKNPFIILYSCWRRKKSNGERCRCAPSIVSHLFSVNCPQKKKKSCLLCHSQFYRICRWQHLWGYLGEYNEKMALVHKENGEWRWETLGYDTGAIALGESPAEDLLYLNMPSEHVPQVLNVECTTR